MHDASAELLNAVSEIRTWLRAAAYPSVKRLLEDALPDSQSRRAYQMTDGVVNRDVICKACTIGTKTLAALQARCVALGLMSEAEGRKERLFDLENFGLLPAGEQPAEKGGGTTNGKAKRSV